MAQLETEPFDKNNNATFDPLKSIELSINSFEEVKKSRK